jgi:phosphonate ABC transporter permease subunit PhnE
LPVNSVISTILSILVPGLGQFYLRHRWRGITIFLCIPILAYLVNWSFTRMNIGKVFWGAQVFSWLWAPFILFWAWNIWDVHNLALGKHPTPLPLVFFAAVILYFIAWQVTDVKLDRLVTRLSDAQLVVTDLVNPDFISIDIAGEKKVCGWVCLTTYLKDRQAGNPTQGPLSVSDNVGDIIGRVVEKPAPKWMVSLGLAASGSKVKSFEGGKLVETIAIGLMATIFSTILAVPISFLAAHNIMSRVPGGNAVYYFMRTILNIIRAVDTVIWGLVVIVWVGMGSFAGVIALTIHSVAALAKLYSEEIEHIDGGPVEAIQATGADLLQVIRFAVMPQIVPPFLSYTLLRWDINMRMATIIGFVAGGGIGFFVIETIRMGAYQQYAAALWAVAVVIIVVDYISAKWRERLLEDKPQETGKSTHPVYKTIRTIFYVVLGLMVFIYCWNISGISLKDLFQSAPTLGRLVTDFLSFDLSPGVVNPVLRDLLITIFQALLATTIGAIFAIPFSFLAAKNLTGRSRLLNWLYYLTRGMFNILRSIEALLYVAIFIFWVGIGPFAGTLALAITTFALVGKLFSEAIENIDYGPMEAILSTGANRLQVINYAILPQIIPPFVSYLIYQWDINIRMATIIGFAGGGGIGLTLSTFFGLLQYRKAGTVIAFIVVVVAVMDFASAKLREKLV